MILAVQELGQHVNETKIFQICELALRIVYFYEITVKLAYYNKTDQKRHEINSFLYTLKGRKQDIFRSLPLDVKGYKKHEIKKQKYVVAHSL